MHGQLNVRIIFHILNQQNSLIKIQYNGSQNIYRIHFTTYNLCDAREGD